MTSSQTRDSTGSKLICQSGIETYGNTEENDGTVESLPEKLCRFYLRKPKVAFGLTLGIQLSLVVVTAVLYVVGYDILPYDFNQVPLNLEKDATKLRADAFNFVKGDSRLNLLPGTVLGQPERSLRYWPIELIYETKYDNVLNKENLEQIAKSEKDLYKIPQYKQICHINLHTKNCTHPLSIVRLFDGTYRQLHPTFYDPDFNNIGKVLNLANNISVTKGLLAFSLDKYATINSNKIHASCIRSLLFNGLPLKGFKHAEDRREEQENKLKALVQETFADELSKRYEEGFGAMKMYYSNLPLFFDAINKQVIYDLLLAGGSFTFIFGFIWFQTGSLWITCWGLLGIVTNFFGANLFYRVLLDFRYIGIFHVLSVFIILGIGADDVFIFYNTWKLMEARKYPSLTIHLTETFRSAASAMFVTSFTTMAAFLASAASPLLGVSSFGVFSGILVMVNYLSVCIFFPSVVVTYHLYWKDCKWLCQSDQTGNRSSDLATSPLRRNGKVIQSCVGKMFKAIVHWFEGPFVTYIVIHRVMRWVLLLIFGAVSIVFVAFAVQLRPDEDQVQVWKPGTNWHDIRKIRTNYFTESGEGNNVIRVYLIWGLKNQDRENCHFTDYKCRGKTVFDESFDLNPPDCQVQMLRFCEKLKNLNKEEAEKLKIRRSVATGELEVSCFMEKLNDYLETETASGVRLRKYPKGTNLSIPFSTTKAKTLMKGNPVIYNESLVTEDYSRYFEVGLGYWLSEGGNPSPGYNYFRFGNWMGGTMDPTADQTSYILSMAQVIDCNTQNYISVIDQAFVASQDKIKHPQTGGRYGNRLRYVAIVVNTSLTGATLRYNEGNRVYNNWETLIGREVSKLPVSCRNAFQCTPEWNNWHWLKVQWVLLVGAVQGIVIGLCVAVPVLVFTTCNWIIGLLASLTIALITNAVVGFIPILGWKLGVMESINLTLVVGLSVDYCVHLADGYVRSKKLTREEKVRDMLKHVGVSVLAGACTTLGASAFMLGAKILFFFQFGMFMFCTIGFSILFALGFFTVVVGFIGPVGSKGSLKNFIVCCLKKDEDTNNSRLDQEHIVTEGNQEGEQDYLARFNPQKDEEFNGNEMDSSFSPTILRNEMSFKKNSAEIIERVSNL